MKQGSASSSGSGARKHEPVSHIVSPGAVSRIGIKEVARPERLETRGASAPAPKAVTIHKSGSQRG